MVATNNHQSDGGGVGSAGAGEQFSLQLSLRVSGAQVKFSKDEKMVESKI